MDRFMYLDHIPDVKLVGKPAVVISTSGAEMIMRPVKYMVDMGVLWWGLNITGAIGIASAMFVASKKYEMKARKKLQETAERFWEDMNRKMPRKPTLKQYLYFVFNKAEDQIGGENQPFRKEHWEKNGWTTSNYYYTTKVNLFYRMLGVMTIILMKTTYRMMMGRDAQVKIQKYLEQRY